MKPIKVTQTVYDQLEACRECAEVNMFHAASVMRWLNRNNYSEAVAWVNENKEQLFDSCLAGFEVE